MEQQRINRTGLSPNQRETKKFPVVGEEWPSTDIEKWRLRVTGLVKNKLDLSRSDFDNLPMVEKIWDTICVTGWTHLSHRWKGRQARHAADPEQAFIMNLQNGAILDEKPADNTSKSRR